MSERFERQAVEGNSPDAIAELRRQQELLQTRLAKGGQLADITGRVGGRVSIGDDGLEIDSDPDAVSSLKLFQDATDTEHILLGEIFTYTTGTSAQMDIHAKAVTDAPWEHAALNLRAFNEDDLALGYYRPQLTVGSDGMSTVVAPYLYVNTFLDTPNSAPTATVGAAGSVPVGTYRYGVTFYGASGQTPLVDDAISDPVTVAGSASQVDLTDVPIGPGGTYGATSRRIYRMNLATGDWGYVGYIGDNTTTTYTDNSAGIGAAPPAWNTSGAMRFSSSANRVINAGFYTMTAINRCWPPPAPVAAQVTTGTGNVPNGTYRYKVSFHDGTSESSASPASNAVVVDNTHKQTTVTLPVGPENITGRRVYRLNTATGAWEYLGLVADNTTVSYTDNIAAGSSFEPARTSGIYLPTSPTYHKWNMYECSGNVGYAKVDSATQFGGEYYNQSSANNGDWFRTPGFVCEGGDWTLTILGATAANRGRLDWYLDGVLVESAQEWYSASTTVNVEKTIALTIPAGWHQLYFTVNGKHASSSNYYIGITSIRLIWVSR